MIKSPPEQKEVEMGMGNLQVRKLLETFLEHFNRKMYRNVGVRPIILVVVKPDIPSDYNGGTHQSLTDTEVTERVTP